MTGTHTSGRKNRYDNSGNAKREDPPKDKNKPTTTVGSGSSLPTPEPETQKLPDIEPSRSPIDMNVPPSQTRAGKAPERPQIPDIPDITPTADMEAIGSIMQGLKQNVTNLENALEGIKKQVGALTALHGPLKLQEELQTVQRELNKQIHKQNEEIKRKRDELEGLLRRQLDEQIKRRIDTQIQEIVKQTVSDRIKEELNKHIPEELKNQSVGHYERTLHIRSNLINSEARRRNANAERTERLHPLVISSRPAAISRSSSGTTAQTPFTAGGFPPTPLDSNSLELFNVRSQDDECPISPAFPSNSQELYHWYSKDRGKIRQLFEDYERENLNDLTDDLQVVNAMNRLFHTFGILGPRGQIILSPVEIKEGQPLSPLIMTSI